ncbi:MAG: methyltransferase domain-containing protein [Candidatus Bathyarchaeia archaeon]
MWLWYGSYFLSAKAKEIFGLEISREVLYHAKGKYKADDLDFIRVDVVNLPFPDNVFDVIV